MKRSVVTLGFVCAFGFVSCFAADKNDCITTWNKSSAAAYGSCTLPSGKESDAPVKGWVDYQPSYSPACFVQARCQRQGGFGYVYAYLAYNPKDPIVNCNGMLVATANCPHGLQRHSH